MNTPRPLYCPNCAARLFEEPHGAQPYTYQGDGPEYEHRVGWDCYCDACDWSGDIEPDTEAQP